jgi:hypothetical protein
VQKCVQLEHVSHHRFVSLHWLKDLHSLASLTCSQGFIGLWTSDKSLFFKIRSILLDFIQADIFW